MENMINVSEIVDYVVKTVQDESILSGFQYIVEFEDIEDEFNISLNDKALINDIATLLSERDEVADVLVTDDGFEGFDVVLYTDFAPNYQKEEYEDFEN